MERDKNSTQMWGFLFTYILLSQISNLTLPPQFLTPSIPFTEPMREAADRKQGLCHSKLAGGPAPSQALSSAHLDSGMGISCLLLLGLLPVRHIVGIEGIEAFRSHQQLDLELHCGLEAS